MRRWSRSSAKAKEQKNLAALRAKRSHSTWEQIVLGTYVLSGPIDEAMEKVKETLAESYEKKINYRIEIRPTPRLEAYVPGLTRDLVVACAHLLRDLPRRMRHKQLFACLDPEQYMYVKYFMKHHPNTFRAVWEECALALDYYDPSKPGSKKALVERISVDAPAHASSAADLIHEFMDVAAAKRFQAGEGVVEAYEAVKRPSRKATSRDWKKPCANGSGISRTSSSGFPSPSAPRTTPCFARPDRL
jgi:hypothetical protein